MKLADIGKAVTSLTQGRAGAGKTFKAGKGVKFVLFVGDEGAILLHVRDNVVLSRQFVPDASEDHLNELREAMAQDAKAPVMLVIDSMDQSYIQQTLPPVSALSVKRLINRRLERDFGGNDIKGAIVLGREQTGRKDWNFMMVALENSTQLEKWLEFIGSLPNRFMGIHLLSVEAETIVRYLEHALGPSLENSGSEWKFLVSHNKVGGFRQVILRNGRIIFTRMAQPIGESTPEVIAGSIEQEMLSTIEYMRRLSFNPQNGLDVYIIASSAIKPVIDKSKFEARNVTVLSPYEVAQHLGIEGATQPTDQFGDVILAATIAASSQHVLTLFTPEFRKFDGTYTLLKYQRIAAAIVMLAIMGYAGNTIVNIISAYADSAELEEKQRMQKHSLEQLQADIKNTDMDISKATDLIDLYKEMADQRLSPVPFIARLETVLKPPIVVKGIEWSVQAPAEHAPPTAQAKMPAVITMAFPGVNTLAGFKTVSNQILEELGAEFKGYDIAFTKLPTIYSERDKVDITFDNNGEGSVAQAGGDAKDVQLTIKGDAALKPPAPAPKPQAAAAAPAK